MPDRFKARLARFFQHYEPTQLKIIDQWVANWAGKERELMEELVAFHGPEPSSADYNPTVAVTSTQQALASECRQLLLQTLLLYAPHRINEADDMLAQWPDAQKPELLRTLKRQVALRDAVQRAYQARFPDRVEEVPSVLRQWLGNERALLEFLSRNTDEAVPPPPTTVNDKTLKPLPFASYREQLQHFYRVHNPDKMGLVDQLLEENAGREPELFAKLSRKYGLTDAAPAAAAAGATTTTTLTTAQRQDAEDHAAIRHLVYATSVERYGELDEFIRKFKGSDSELAWALRTFCRNNNTSPQHYQSLDDVVTKLERRVAAEHASPPPRHQPKPRSVIVSPSKPQTHLSLCEELSRVGLADLTPVFVKHDIDLSLLSVLDGEDLRKMGIEPAGRRDAVLEALAR